MTELVISLILAVAIVISVAAASLLLKRLKYRSELRKRGVDINEVTGSPETQLLVVDYIYSWNRGLVSPVVWWIPNASVEKVQIDDGDLDQALLVDLPPAMRSRQSLELAFPSFQVIENLTIHEPPSSGV
ncbi:hypothetical protein [Aeoliella sp.]|uniref:hypothetical protein n=1 Tax=Aeoliella sp. TaxID=2795800 RepID=UPI003CCB95A3